MTYFIQGAPQFCWTWALYEDGMRVVRAQRHVPKLVRCPVCSLTITVCVWCGQRLLSKPVSGLYECRPPLVKGKPVRIDLNRKGI
jgi:hypothetical protein